MASPEVSSDQRLSSDMLAEVIQVLQDIYNGSSVMGRWYCEEHRQTVGYDPEKPDEGYFDQNLPPPGYDANGCLGDNDETAAAESFKPAEWEEYTPEEQSRWLRTCANLAKKTLKKLGVHMVDPDGAP